MANEYQSINTTTELEQLSVARRRFLCDGLLATGVVAASAAGIAGCDPKKTASPATPAAPSTPAAPTAQVVKAPDQVAGNIYPRLRIPKERNVTRAAFLAISFMGVATGCSGNKADGTCTVKSGCQPGQVCIDGACSDLCGSGSPCRDGQVCSSAGNCEDVPDTAECGPGRPACDDGNACTAQTCNGGQCELLTTTTCEAASGCHEVGVCDAGTGRCSNPLRPDDSNCKVDGNAGSCEVGVCAVDCSVDAGLCKDSQSCDAGFCRTFCSATLPCPSTQQACQAGRCVASANPPPAITHVEGNHLQDCPMTPSRTCMLDGIIVEGLNFGGATFALQDSVGTDVSLAHLVSTDTTAEFLLPTAIAAGRYTLTVANTHGNAVQALELLQGPPGPDLDADALVLRINGSTETLTGYLPTSGGSLSGDLQVGGTLKIGGDGAACGVAGIQRWNATRDALEVCNGSDWVPVSGELMLPAPVLLLSSALERQFFVGSSTATDITGSLRLRDVAGAAGATHALLRINCHLRSNDDALSYMLFFLDPLSNKLPVLSLPATFADPTLLAACGSGKALATNGEGDLDYDTTVSSFRVQMDSSGDVAIRMDSNSNQRTWAIYLVGFAY